MRVMRTYLLFPNVHLGLIEGKYAHKKTQYNLFYITADWQWQLCAFSLFRWKFGFRISAPSIKRSWSMAADQRESISTALAPSLPARPGCPSFGRSPWRTREPKCTQTVTWTVLVTGIRTTILTRTRWRGLRWCEWTVFGAAQVLGPIWRALQTTLNLLVSLKASSQNWIVFKTCV